MKNKLVAVVMLLLLSLAARAVAEGQFAKMDFALADTLAALTDQDEVLVGVWLIPSRDPNDITRERREPGGELRRQELQADARALMEETQMPLVQFLTSRGYEPVYASQYAPLVFVQASKATISELAKLRDVDRVYLSRECGKSINHAAKSERADIVWARDVNGNGIEIAVVESGRIAFNNTYLAAGTTRLPHVAPDEHKTAVAGIIAANGGTPSDRYKGVAWGAPGLLSADCPDQSYANLVSATDWAISQGAKVVNMSLGLDVGLVPSALDGYVDYIVRHEFVTVVVAAGNDGPPRSGGSTGSSNVETPGTAYNAITVGSFYDSNTFKWSGDGMSTFSSHVDPQGIVVTNILHSGNSTGLTPTVLTDAGAAFPVPNKLVGKYLNPNTDQPISFLITANTATAVTVQPIPDPEELPYSHTEWTLWHVARPGNTYQVREESRGNRVKPEVVAVGDGVPGTADDIETTRISAPWIGNEGQGTSYAAPAVTGEVALILERDNTLGGGLAIWPEAIKAIIMASACHDIEAGSMEKDGAGGIVACEADEIVKNRQLHYQTLWPSDFTGGYWKRNIGLKAGRKARIVICWNSNPTRSVVTGTITALTKTQLTDNNGAPFGTERSKFCWFLNPNTARDHDSLFTVRDNTATTLTVFPNDDLTKEASVGDTYRLFSYPEDPLDANLDLEIVDPSTGSVVGSSKSQYNNFELVDFVPGRTATYEVRVSKPRFDGDSEFIGLAWTQEPCCSPDWGDAPDDMPDCAPPNKGDFPTLEASSGARAREFEVEWLSEDNTTSPGATWEMDADVAPHEAEKDQDGVSNIRPAACLADKDKEDDGVELSSALEAGKKARVSFWVNSATPSIGRYSDTRIDEKIYVSGWIDWEHDNTSWVGNDVVRWEGGPGMPGHMPLGTCIEGCDPWDVSQHQKKVVAEFDVPPTTVAGPLWSRFRLSYGEPVTTVTEAKTYGEVEDYVLTVPIKVIERKKIHQGSYEGGAQGLYVRVWQKEDDIEIMDWDVEVSPEACVETGRASQPDPSHSQRETTDGSPGDPDNGMHAVGINIWFNESVDYCEYVTIDVTLWLTAWNTVREAEIEWWNFPE